jgi:hypothetical protein
MSKSKRIWIAVGIALIIAAIIIVPNFIETEHDFIELEAEYTDADGSTAVYGGIYSSYIGYKWMVPVEPLDEDSELYMETRLPDGSRKYPVGSKVIPDAAADSPITLRFERGRKAPDKVTVYVFGEGFSSTDELRTENADSVLQLGGGKRTYVIDDPAPETTYWVKACWGDEYLYYLIPLTDLDVRVT